MVRIEPVMDFKPVFTGFENAIPTDRTGVALLPARIGVKDRLFDSDDVVVDARDCGFQRVRIGVFPKFLSVIVFRGDLALRLHLVFDEAPNFFLGGVWMR